jgi:hypothetical protein
MNARTRTPVAKRLDDAIVIKVSDGFDGGLFCIRTGVRNDSRWVELTIHSSYGNYGYFWSNTGDAGSTAIDFLGRVDRDYLMNKLVENGNYMRFDAELTADGIREWIRQSRRDRSIEKAEAREMYDAVEEAEGDSQRFFEALKDECETLFWKHSLYELSRDAPDRAAVQFYETLWPAFIAELSRDTTQPES